MTLGAFPETFPDHPQGPMNDDLPGTQTCCASAPAGRAPHLRKSRAVVPARGGAPPTSVNGRLATGLYGGSQRLQSHSSEQEMAPGLGSGVCPHPRPLGLSPCCPGLGVRSGPQLDWSPRQRLRDATSARVSTCANTSLGFCSSFLRPHNPRTFLQERL